MCLTHRKLNRLQKENGETKHSKSKKDKKKKKSPKKKRSHDSDDSDSSGKRTQRATMQIPQSSHPLGHWLLACLGGQWVVCLLSTEGIVYKESFPNLGVSGWVRGRAPSSIIIMGT